MRRPLIPEKFGLVEAVLLAALLLLILTPTPFSFRVEAIFLVALVLIYIWDRLRVSVVPAETVIIRKDETFLPGDEYKPYDTDQTVKLRPDSEVVSVQDVDPKTREALSRSVSLVWRPDANNLSAYLENRDRKKLVGSFQKLLQFNIHADKDDVEAAFYSYASHYGILFDRVDASASAALDESIEATISKFEKRIGLSARGRSIANINREFEEFERAHEQEMKNPAFAMKMKNLRTRFITEVMDAN